MLATIRARRFCAAAAALGAVGVLPAPNVYAQPPLPLAPPGQNCTFPSDGFTINRADGSMLVVGSQSGGVGLGPNGIFDAGGDRIVGNVNRGAIVGSKVEFTIDYEGGPNVRPSEKYTGQIFEDGSVSGDAYDYTNPKVHWTAVRGAIACTN
jgi:hypothetical protein